MNTGVVTQKSAGKLANRLVLGDDDDDDVPKKKRKVTSATRKVRPTVMSRFVGTDVSSVEKVIWSIPVNIKNECAK